jgi:hypothetical protein
MALQNGALFVPLQSASGVSVCALAMPAQASVTITMRMFTKERDLVDFMMSPFLKVAANVDGYRF